MTVFFRKRPLRESILPKGGVARFYGTAKSHKSGAVYDEVWDRMIEPEKKSDPDKRGYAVLIKSTAQRILAGRRSLSPDGTCQQTGAEQSQTPAMAVE